MTIVGHVDAEPWERAAYLKRSATERRAAGVCWLLVGMCGAAGRLEAIGSGDVRAQLAGHFAVFGFLGHA